MTTNDQLNAATALTPVVAKTPSAPLLFETEVDALCAAYTQWYNGTRRDSEKELARFLDSCLALVKRLKAATADDRQAFTDLLLERGIQCQTNTSLERKVLLASGCKESLVDGYVTVIKKAMAQMRSGETMLQFFDRRGGVDAIRRSDSTGVSKAELREQHCGLAIEELRASTAIGAPFEPTPDVTPKDDGDYGFAAALVQLDADGNAIIVGGTNDQTVVRTALEAIGKSIDAEIEATALENAKKAALNERQRKLGVVGQNAGDDEDETATTVGAVDAA